MPIVPPFPIKLLETIDAVIHELREIAAKNPDSPELTEAAADLTRAAERLRPLAGKESTTV